MSHKIIDMHSHLGNNLYHNGGELIGKTGVKKKKIFDPISISELILYRKTGTENLLEKWIVKAARERNLTATLENLQKSMDRVGVVYTVCLPISLHFVPFNDLNNAAQQDKRIIPFTSLDHTKEYDFNEAFNSDVAEGAKGLKLHPIIQSLSLSDQRTFNAVEAFAPHGLPVLFHSGVFSYYPGEGENKENPEYGEIHYAVELVKAFPNVRFVAGHSGLFEIEAALDLLSSYKNVYADTSLQPPGNIRKIINTFGRERVVFGSDWPFGNTMAAYKSVKKACDGDKSLEEQILGETAAELMGISL